VTSRKTSRGRAEDRGHARTAGLPDQQRRLASPHRTIDEFSVEDFEACCVSTWSVASRLQVCAAIPEENAGSIINMSSLVGSIGQEWASIYAATKGGIIASPRPWQSTKAETGCG